MKIAEYSDIRAKHNSWRQAEQFIDVAITEMKKGPNFKSEDDYYIQSQILQLDPILTCLEGKLEGKTILDLGCGSNSPRLEGFYIIDSYFEPWLCRTLNVLGANPIGIDFGDLKNEKFRHYSRDLNNPDSLTDIESHSVDIANTCQLFDSPFPEFILNVKPGELKRNLFPQLERVLKPDAYFIHFEG